jgi:hypothetical protein
MVEAHVATHNILELGCARSWNPKSHRRSLAVGEATRHVVG